jgi:hypothetical protein
MIGVSGAGSLDRSRIESAGDMEIARDVAGGKDVGRIRIGVGRVSSCAGR